jgi:branched-chain amino acid transport system substrate-binding protein
MIAVSVVLGLLAAGCGGGGGSGPISIGLISTLTGPETGVGEDVARGMQFGIDQVNEAGGIRARKLTLVKEDSKYSAEVAVAAARKLIETDGVPVIVNGTHTDVLLQWLEQARAKGVVVLNVAATTQAGEEQTSLTKTVFTLGVPAAVLGRELARWAHESHRRKIAVLGPDGPFGAEFRQAAAEEFGRLGGVVAVSSAYKPGQPDYTADLRQIAAKGPDAIVLGLYGRDGKQLFTQATAVGLTVPWYVSYPTQIVLEDSSQAVGRLFGLEVGYTTSSAQEFRKRFAASFPGHKPTAWSAFTYDGMWLLAQAMRQQGQNTKGIAAVYIRGAPGYSGATGQVTFSEDGNRVQPPLERLQMTRQGELVPAE